MVAWIHFVIHHHSDLKWCWLLSSKRDRRQKFRESGDVTVQLGLERFFFLQIFICELSGSRCLWHFGQKTTSSADKIETMKP